jgi:hypothetical protein
VDGVVMEGETAETLGVVRLLRRAGELAWVRAEAEGPRSPRQLVALGIDLAAGEARNLLRERVDVVGPTPIGDDEVGLLRSAEQLRRTVIGVPDRRLRLTGTEEKRPGAKHQTQGMQRRQVLIVPYECSCALLHASRELFQFVCGGCGSSWGAGGGSGVGGER